MRRSNKQDGPQGLVLRQLPVFFKLDRTCPPSRETRYEINQFPNQFFVKHLVNPQNDLFLIIPFQRNVFVGRLFPPLFVFMLLRRSTFFSWHHTPHLPDASIAHIEHEEVKLEICHSRDVNVLYIRCVQPRPGRVQHCMCIYTSDLIAS